MPLRLRDEDLYWLRKLKKASAPLDPKGVPAYSLSRLIALGLIEKHADQVAITPRGDEALRPRG
jgi:hypothetical protein